MGTNYYHRTNICGCCDRYDEAHICKSMTSFEGPVRWLDEPPYGPVVELGSWQAWRERILAGGEVWDEYGGQIEPETFVARVERTSLDDRRRQHEWMLKNAPNGVSDGPEEGKSWLDADGFSFYGGTFS